MYFDTLTMAAVADELRRVILGGRVQKVLLPGDLSVGLEIYAQGRRRYLLAAAHPQAARLCLAGGKLRRGVESPTPLLLLLRKHVRGAVLTAIEQPPLERILRMRFDHPQQGPTTLIAEIMGRRSNVVLADASGTVLECVKRIGPDVSRYRVILPQHPYVPPPPGRKPVPTELTELRLRQLVEAMDPDAPLWRGLVRELWGLSPLLAREIAFRGTGQAETLAGEVRHIAPILAAVGALFSPLETGGWQPSVVREPDGSSSPGPAREVAAFAPYPLTHLPGHEPVDSISAAVESYFAGLVAMEAYAAPKRRWRQVIHRERKRRERKRAALERALAAAEQAEEWRRKGEWILAYATQIEPRQEELRVETEPGQPPLSIALDPALSAADNAQRYFKRYRKAREATRGVPALLAAVDLELRYLDQLETDLDLAASEQGIREVQAALIEAGYIRGARERARAGRSQPLKLTSPDGLTVLVGRNSRQNDEVTFRRALPGDLWLHARGVPGAHVVVRTGGRPVPETTLQWAAALAAHYSRARDEGMVDVDYTERRHVRRLKGAGPGLVTYSHERTLRVRPAGPE